MSGQIEFIKSEKGKPRLLSAGYLYYKDFCSNKTTYWRCIKYRTLHCRARVHTISNVVSRQTGIHNHAADAPKIVADRISNEIKRQALETNNSPHAVITEAYQQCPLSVASSLTQISSMKRTIRRLRQNDSDFPNENPTLREDINIPDQFKITNKGEEFLLFDSGNISTRMLIFGTKRNLLLLSQNREWYSDGTFKTCPKLFAQLYTIHIIRNNKSIPLVYALLPNKNQSTYTELFTKLKELEPTLNPISIMTDLEKAAINAFKLIFPEICIRLCYFHFKQCLYRKLQTEGLKSNYDTDSDFSQKVRMIAALAYVKKEDVEDSFVKLAAKLPEILDGFVDYFGKEFVGYVDLRGQTKMDCFRFSNGIFITIRIFPKQITTLRDGIEDLLNLYMNIILQYGKFSNSFNWSKEKMKFNIYN